VKIFENVCENKSMYRKKKVYYFLHISTSKNILQQKSSNPSFFKYHLAPQDVKAEGDKLEQKIQNILKMTEVNTCNHMAVYNLTW